MKKTTKVLIILFIISVAFRLYFAFQTNNFTYDAYFDFRQIQSIASSGSPIFQDPLSFGGRFFLFSPIFHYILAFFQLIFKTQLILKIIPNIFASSLVFIVYAISKKLTNNTNKWKNN